MQPPPEGRLCLTASASNTQLGVIEGTTSIAELEKRSNRSSDVLDSEALQPVSNNEDKLCSNRPYRFLRGDFQLW